MDLAIGEFTSDPKSVETAQNTARLNLDGTGRSWEQRLSDSAEGQYRAKLTAKEAILEAGRMKEYSNAKTPQEKVNIIAESILSKNPGMPKEEVWKRAVAAYEAPGETLMKGVSAGSGNLFSRK